MRTQLDIALDGVIAALRGVRRSPGFSLAVVATLAVGVGGDLATFSVVDRLLFRPPPGIKDGGDIRRIYSRERSSSGQPPVWYAFSIPDLRDFAEASRGSATVAGHRVRNNLALGDSTLRVRGAYVSDGYFELFGLRPRLGRLFVREEMSGTSSTAALISEPLWQRVFGSTPGVIGRVIGLAGEPVTIVGVIDGPFQGIDLEPTDIWLPLPPAAERSSSRDWRGIELIARITAAGREQALAERLTDRFRRTRTMVARGDSAAVVRLAPLAQARGEGLLMPMDLRSVALTKRLAGVAAAVLVVSIGNVLVLFLVRAVRRRRELAVRVALGASRLRIASEQILEGLLLGAMAAIVAVLGGAWGGGLLGSWLLPPTAVGPIVDRHAIGIASLTTLAIGTLVGLTSVLFGPPVDGGQALRLDASSGDNRGTQLRIGLLATQTAVCIALITVAASFQQSLLRLARTNLGVDRERMITVFATPQMREGAVREALARIRTLPEVVAAANAGNDLSGGFAAGRFAIAGRPDIPTDAGAPYMLVDTAYFRAVGIPVLYGRGLEPADFVEPAAVAVISRAMAQTYWPGRSALGDCLLVLGNTSRCVRVVGVVGDIRWDLSSAPQPQYYMPLGSDGVTQGPVIVVRTRGGATAATVAEIDRIAARTLGNNVTRPRVARVADRLDRQIRPWRGAATLFLLFGLLALLGSAAGVYATVTYEMAQRRTELAVRLTLGASLSQLMQVVVRPVARACAIGAVVGLALAIAGGRVIAAFLFDTTPSNFTALLIGVATVSGAAFLATLAPSWRTTRLNLASVLRG